MKKFKLTLPAELESLKKVQEFIENFAYENDLSSKTLFNLNLIIEEIVVNICSYSYSENEKGMFTIEISLENDEIILTFSDFGIPFDPSTKDVTFKDSVLNTDIGGLGIHIVKELSKSLSYKYENNQNILKIVLSGEKKN